MFLQTNDLCNFSVTLVNELVDELILSIEVSGWAYPMNTQMLA